MISFILPAYNEAELIGETLKAINKFSPTEDYEIIVSDNKSTDDTAKIAASFGAIVVESNDSTISGVRNTGVKNSKGDILVFLDSDVRITKQWQSSISQVIKELRHEPNQITGFRCMPPENGFWINTYWFKLMTVSTSNQYINSGHLITTKALFDNINGFNEELRTGEDYDFCQRALKLGAAITPNPSLITVHDGYPSTLIQFVQRERWHGREDFNSLSTLLKSKVGLLACFHVVTLIGSIFTSIALMSLLPMAVYCFISFFSCISVAIWKFKPQSFKALFYNTLLNYFYFWGRSLSLYDRLSGKYATRIREQA